MDGEKKEKYRSSFVLVSSYLLETAECSIREESRLKLLIYDMIESQLQYPGYEQGITIVHPGIVKVPLLK